MKAAQIHGYGGSEQFVLTDVSEPQPKKNQVLVKVYASSINPFDVKLLSGVMKAFISLEFPVVLGGDFAGVVTRGDDEGVYKEGDEVFGSALILNGGSGGYAQFAAANVANISLKPKNIGFEEAGSLPLVSASAVQALEEHIRLKPNQKILIHGGAGGIGSIAIQIARSIGAHVATTVSANDVNFVKSLGAGLIIDYKKIKFEDEVFDYDAVFDTVAGETGERSLSVLKKGGIIVSMLGAPNPEKAKELGVTSIGQNTNTNTQHLKRIAELVEQGEVKPMIDIVYPLDQIAEAYEYQKTASPKGKVVIKVA